MPIIIYLFLSALLVLPACTGPIDTGPGLDEIVDRFAEAMRWQDYFGAAIHLQEDTRSDFLEQFKKDEDLHVVESQVDSIEFDLNTGSAVADYRLDYYRLPSLRVKKWQWAQQWQLRPQKGLKMNSWQIINSPPPVL